MNAPVPAGATVVSTKGQVILPKAIRDSMNWPPGTRLLIEKTADGVTLKAEPRIPPTRFEDVRGMLAYSGPAKTIEEMNEGIAREIRRRHERGRY